MRFISVAVQAFRIGKDGVGEVVVFVDEEIHFLSGTIALRNQIVQLDDSPVLFVQSFSDTLWKEVGIDFTEDLHTKNPGVCKPNDYEKRAGGARRERVRITSPLTVGDAGLALSMASKGRIGC